MDETYIRVKGQWTYLYGAVDRDGQTLDFLLSERRDLVAARRFFKGAIGSYGLPDWVVIDKSGANLAGLQAVNLILKFTGGGRTIEIRQLTEKYDRACYDMSYNCILFNWRSL